jgi:hypothetical protein
MSSSTLRRHPGAICGKGYRAARAGFAAAVLAASAAFADPPAPPEGWSSRAGAGLQIYHFARAGRSVELHLFAREDDARGLDAWFQDRTAGGMPGISAARFQPATSPSGITRIANGTGRDANGRPVRLVLMGCQLPHGGLQFAQAVFSDDDVWIRTSLPATANVFTTACLQGATDADVPRRREASGMPARVDPAPAAKPAPYRFVTAPGGGLAASDIEAIVRRWANEQSGMTMQVRTYYTLLLKDGSAMDGLPIVALADFDVAASKKAEPQWWGHWTRIGGKYHVAYANGSVWDYDRDAVRIPARRSEFLEGTWEGYSAYSTMYAVSQSRWSVTFGSDGRFVKSSSHSTVGSAGVAAAGNVVGGAVVTDDHGTTATMGGGNFSARSTRRAGGADAQRMGTYRLDGYTLELRYDDGVVERKTFCATADHSNIWFEDAELSRQRVR